MKPYNHSGFFVLRTPLLPFDEILAWSEGLQSAQAADSAELDQALASDRTCLRKKLSQVFSRNVIRDALFVASPDLDNSIEVWRHERDTERTRRIERALVRYFMRMAARPTPFGLFAGTSVGIISDHTQLTLQRRENYERHTRLDMDYLCALVDSLKDNPDLRSDFTYRPNSSLYRSGNHFRYVESENKDKKRSYRLASIEQTGYLRATLQRAEQGASIHSLAAALIDESDNLEDAKEYICELIDNQILVPNIMPNVTGPEPIHPLVTELSKYPKTHSVSAVLKETREQLLTIDGKGLGVSPEEYRKLALLLESLPAEVDLHHLFQVDMTKPSDEAMLGKEVVEEILRGVEVMHNLAPRRDPEILKRFSERFVSRYEAREVPLLKALDEESGIGFESADDTSPLLNGFPLATKLKADGEWSDRETFLMSKLNDALQTGAYSIELTRDDLKVLNSNESTPLPDALVVTAVIASSSAEALKRGDFQVVMENTFGPSGAQMLGRFCHGDPTLRTFVESHLRAEEALHPDAIFAEIVHLPEGRVGNVLCRPLLRKYEIPYLGISGTPPDFQIPISDLLISVSGNRIHLRSQRLDREVIPRMTNAHNYRASKLGVYKFLCTLQQQGITWSFGWDWGVLQNAPFLPRVTMGRLIFSKARWRIKLQDLKHLFRMRDAELFRTIQEWRKKWKFPRWIALQDYDNVLPIDLDNILSIESFIQLIKTREEITLVEMFPTQELLCAFGPEGKFAHEIIVPLVASKTVSVPPTLQSIKSIPNTKLPRTFPPGSEWLYVKLYAGETTVDNLLRDVLSPVIRKTMDSHAADQWFFIRYGDPDWHLRLRFHGSLPSIREKVLPAIHQALDQFVQSGELWRIQLDTYQREVERYGGSEGIELAERIFHIDSEAVLQIIELLEPGNQGLEERWQLTLLGIDLLLGDFGFDLRTKLSLMQEVRDAFCKEFHVDAELRKLFGEKLRNERRRLQQLLNLNPDDDHSLASGLKILRQRSNRLAPIIADLKSLVEDKTITFSLEDLTQSYVHMFANRLLRSAQRKQELVIYDFLTKLYESDVAQKMVRV